MSVNTRWGRYPRSRRRLPESVRQFVLKRDEYLCQIGGMKCVGTATQVDHVVPDYLGGSDEPENLRGVCKNCHLEKSLAEAQDGNTRRRARGYYPEERHPGLL